MYYKMKQFPLKFDIMQYLLSTVPHLFPKRLFLGGVKFYRLWRKRP